MQDPERRRLARRFQETRDPGDELAWLRHVVAGGGAEALRVELAAAFDHEPALAALEARPRAGWAALRRGFLHGWWSPGPRSGAPELVLEGPWGEPRRLDGRRPAVIGSSRTAELRWDGDRSLERAHALVGHLAGAGFYAAALEGGRATMSRANLNGRRLTVAALEVGDVIQAGRGTLRVAGIAGIGGDAWAEVERERAPASSRALDGPPLPLDPVRAAVWLRVAFAAAAPTLPRATWLWLLAARARVSADARAFAPRLERLANAREVDRAALDRLCGEAAPDLARGVCWELSDAQEAELRREGERWHASNPGRVLVMEAAALVDAGEARPLGDLGRVVALVRDLGLEAARRTVVPWLLPCGDVTRTWEPLRDDLRAGGPDGAG